MNKILDCDWGRRMDMLVVLMQQNPKKKMKKLQAEALKYYPLYYNSSIRNWMSWRTANIAADHQNKREGLYDDYT